MSNPTSPTDPTAPVPPTPLFSLHVDCTTPLWVDTRCATHMHLEWRGAAATFIIMAIQKYGGTFGDFITDAIRFYFWYMSTTDRATLVSIPYGKVSDTLTAELDRVGAETLEPNF